MTGVAQELPSRCIQSYRSLQLLIPYFDAARVHEVVARWLPDMDTAVAADVIRAAVALLALGKSERTALNAFRTNRYFREAVGITSEPSAADLDRCLDGPAASLEGIVAEMRDNLKSRYGDVRSAGNATRDSSNRSDLLLLRPFCDDCLDHLEASGAARELVSKAKSPYTAEVRRQFEENGYAIIEGVLPDDEADSTRELVLKLAEWERQQGCAFFYGAGDRLQRIYNLLNKHGVFRDLIQRPLILEIMDDLFRRDTLHDKYVLASWHANIIGPDGGAQILHVDAAVPEPLPPWIIRANINYLLEDYTESNGATLCLPGSHRFLRKPKAADQERGDLIRMTGRKGSLAIWDGHLWHRSGSNNTQKERVALLGCFAASHLLEMCTEEQHLAIIDRAHIDAMSPTLKQLIGVEHGLKRGALQQPPPWL